MQRRLSLVAARAIADAAHGFHIEVQTLRWGDAAPALSEVEWAEPSNLGKEFVGSTESRPTVCTWRGVE